MQITSKEGGFEARDTRLDAAWMQITSKEGRFTAWFPCEPEHNLLEGDLVHQYLAETNGGSVAFLISYTPQTDVKVTLDERLRHTQTVMKSVKGKVAPVMVSGVPARELSHEYVHDGVRYVSRQRIVYVGDSMYQLSVVAASDPGVTEDDIQRFYSGFNLSGSTR
jgi:hypothetical protein